MIYTSVVVGLLTRLKKNKGGCLLFWGQPLSLFCTFNLILFVETNQMCFAETNNCFQFEASIGFGDIKLKNREFNYFNYDGISKTYTARVLFPLTDRIKFQSKYENSHAKLFPNLYHAQFYEYHFLDFALSNTTISLSCKVFTHYSATLSICIGSNIQKYKFKKVFKSKLYDYELVYHYSYKEFDMLVGGLIDYILGKLTTGIEYFIYPYSSYYHLEQASFSFFNNNHLVDLFCSYKLNKINFKAYYRYFYKSYPFRVSQNFLGFGIVYKI
ncbi:MAG: hypothetical protein N2662_06665 [Bacteroidales bacterium]|nr:hypothetical protein [Bacteroidales bacterium]